MRIGLYDKILTGYCARQTLSISCQANIMGTTEQNRCVSRRDTRTQLRSRPSRRCGALRTAVCPAAGAQDHVNDRKENLDGKDDREYGSQPPWNPDPLPGDFAHHRRDQLCSRICFPAGSTLQLDRRRHRKRQHDHAAVLDARRSDRRHAHVEDRRKKRHAARRRAVSARHADQQLRAAVGPVAAVCDLQLPAGSRQRPCLHRGYLCLHRLVPGQARPRFRPVHGLHRRLVRLPRADLLEARAVHRHHLHAAHRRPRVPGRVRRVRARRPSGACRLHARRLCRLRLERGDPAREL